MDYLMAFLVGGALCAIAQIIMDTRKLQAGEILVVYITAGVILSGLGLYDYIVEIGGSGATVPLMGFGYSLVKGTIRAVNESGLIGVFTGGLTATSAGICAAIVFGYLMSLLGKAKTKY